MMRWLEEKRLSGPFLYLDGVQNPHNLGSILRIASHFGVSAILGAKGDLHRSPRPRSASLKGGRSSCRSMV